MAEVVGDPYATARLRNFMNPEKPIMSGAVQNQDAYMKVLRRDERPRGLSKDRLVVQGNLRAVRHGYDEVIEVEVPAHVRADRPVEGLADA